MSDEIRHAVKSMWLDGLATMNQQALLERAGLLTENGLTTSGRALAESMCERPSCSRPRAYSAARFCGAACAAKMEAGDL